MIWFFIVLVCVIIILVLLALIIKYKHELRSLTSQIKDVKNETTHKYIDISLIDSDLEDLAYEINSLIKKQEELYISARNHEAQLKEYIANISHDLRTPLTSILGYIFLVENSDNPDKDEAIRVIADKANLLNELIQNFYELSVIDDDKYELTMERIDIVTVATNILVGCYTLFDEKNITPDIMLPNHAVYVSANMLACERILQNLIVNAVLYSVNKVKMRLSPIKDKCVITISNDAPNLNNEAVEHLFERFYTADDSRNSGRSGLGLSIVKTLSEKIEAEIVNVALIEGELEITLSFNLWT